MSDVRKLTVDENAAAAALDPNDFFIKMSITLGPKLLGGVDPKDASRLRELLKKEVREHHDKGGGGLAYQVLGHILEHMEAGASFSGPTISNVYYGCGSCVNNGRDASLCIQDGGGSYCDGC